MAVLIKGMEMPKDTCEIRITVDQEGCWWARRIDVEDEWHEVSELTPHGRLIDADKLKIRVKLMNWCMKHYPDKFMDEVVHAPTIIEAEE